MENSTRQFNDENLLKLTKKTYKQINKGFKNCDKDGINNACDDIKHSYINAWKNLTKYDNVLILEDDAVFNKKYSINEFRVVDNFLKNNNFSIYSLGSVSLNFPTFSYNKKIIVGFGCTQGVIYSKAARAKLIYVNGKHVDTGVIIKLSDKYKYKYPLICQTFPATTNNNDWSKEKLNIPYVNFIKLCNAGNCIEPFWSSIYYLDTVVWTIIILILFVYLYK
jgi:hypothetical protein